MARNPWLRPQSMMRCIRRRPRPVPFIAGSTTMANSASSAGLAHQPGDAERLAVVDRDDRHLAVVVDWVMRAICSGGSSRSMEKKR